MKSLVCILILIVSFSSCSSFDRMQYRHLRKVPASPISFTSEHKIGDGEVKKYSAMNEVVNDTSREVMAEVQTTNIDSIITDTLLVKAKKLQSDSVQFTRKNSAKSYTKRSVLRKDWSVLMAVIMIFAGILLIFYCIFVLPAFNILLLFIIALEVLFAFAAVKLFVRGVSIIRNHYRQSDSHKETERR